MNIAYYNSPIGIMRICDNGTAITEVQVIKSASEAEIAAGGCEMPSEYADQNQATSALAKACIKQLAEYFAGDRKTFDLPMEFNGTDFQKRVWQALCKIPYGETRSYKEIAEAVGSPKAFRAVGMANNKNSIMILAPCHRVIGANGSLVGFATGLPAKEYLLKLEQNHR